MNIIDPEKYGISFSVKQCRNFDIDQIETLNWLIEDAGFRRFRLMSYWDEHEKVAGKFDFGLLDKQIKNISEAGGLISLCLGVRQPRWPENHWPNWAWNLSKKERDQAILSYVEKVVLRYKDNPAIVSYQLENEALLTNFGERPDTDRKRLLQEYDLVKNLDKTKPIIMTTSTSWGLPIRRPIPDIVGFSYYHTLYQNGKYRRSLFYPGVHSLRKKSIRLLHNKPVFIHELQLEPWGPTAIWKMSSAEQSKSMSTADIKRSLRLANKINAYPIDLWGGEWWYWRLKHGDPSIWEAVEASLRYTNSYGKA